MKSFEFITEAKMNPEIRKNLEMQGYRFLGKGQDQDVYLAPDGTILKIFGTDRGSQSGYTEGQQSFIDFANYCKKNKNNPFLPHFGGWGRFEFEGELYLQIKCERLFDFDKEKANYIASFLEDFADSIDAGRSPKHVMKRFEKDIQRGKSWDSDRDNDERAMFAMYIGGEKAFNQLLTAMEDLSKIADRRNYGFDLHPGNFMLGSDGHIVINDPFFTGTWR